MVIQIKYSYINQIIYKSNTIIKIKMYYANQLVLYKSNCKNTSSSKQLIMALDLFNYISNPLQDIPLVTLSLPFCSKNPVYETIEFIGEDTLHSHYPLLQKVTQNSFKFDAYRYSFCLYEEPTHGTKITIHQWFCKLIFNDELRKDLLFNRCPLGYIVNNIRRKQFLLMKVDSKNNTNCSKFFILTTKPKTNNSTSASVRVGEKLDIQMYMKQEIYEEFSMHYKLTLFHWLFKFSQYILSSFKWDLISNTAIGYYYNVRYDKMTNYHIDISIKFPIDNTLLKYKCKSQIVYPYILYNAALKPLYSIDFYNAAHGRSRKSHLMYIVHRMWLNVVNDEISQRILSCYKVWLCEGHSGYHEYFPSAHNMQFDNYYRIKSYLFKKYYYNSAMYKSMKNDNQIDKNTNELVTDNVAAGLRVIPNDFLPEWLEIVKKYLFVITGIDLNYVDQIGINLYQHKDGSSKPKCVSFSSIAGHDEWDKYDKLCSLSLGNDTVLSYDVKGGCVNGSVGLELPARSFVEHDMSTYFQNARKMGGSGGKHSISKRHLVLFPNQWRLVILFRRCVPKEAHAALRHLLICKNDDKNCFCLK